MKSFPLLFFILVVPLAFATIPNCILKIVVLSPINGYFAPAVPSGTANVFISVNVTNASSDSPVAGTANFTFDNGTTVSIPSTGNGNYSLAVADYRQGTHAFTVSADAAGCIDDSVSEEYYYQPSAIRSVPEFNPLLAPFVGIAAIFAARAFGRRKGRK